jgi:uncharacterized protein (DUF427 family)
VLPASFLPERLIPRVQRKLHAFGDLCFRRRSGPVQFSDRGRPSVLFFEDSPRRVHVVFNDETVADSRSVKLLHETGRTPVYYFPEADVRQDLLRPSGEAIHANRSAFAGLASRSRALAKRRRTRTTSTPVLHLGESSRPSAGRISVQASCGPGA